MKTIRKIYYSSVLVLTSGLLCAAEVVQLDSGPISGLDTNGLRVFKGIPYAAPPVGALRWKPPQSVTTWSTVLNCTNFGPSCPQPASSEAVGITSEDCLYLNVWAPASNANASLPVMVWIHGGGWTIGSGSLSRYDGTALVQKGVVFVNFNYRLGPFGFLVHPLLSRESPRGVSGNYGLLDQVAALQWVQRNIAAFGGDPGRVTIFGESAGSMSVAKHLICPLSTGLFHRAISESGGPYGESYITPQSDGQMAKAIQMGNNLAALLQCDTAPDVLQALRAKTSAEILAVFDFTLAPFSPGMKFTPVIDGYVIPDDPAQLYAGGQAADVPVIIGSNADEGNTFYEVMSVDRYQYWIQLNFGRRADEVFAMFPATGSNDVRSAFDRLAATAIFAEPARDAASSWNVKTSKVYLYQFIRVAPYAASLNLGAYHGVEIPYVFGQIDPSQGLYNETDAALSSAMMNYWVNFAATGDPNGTGLLAWPSYDPSTRQNMEFGDTNRINNHLLEQECELLGQFHQLNITVPAPGGVFATDGIYADRVQVSWPGVYGASAYEVWRNTLPDTASAGKLATIPDTLYNDTDIRAGTVYYYWARTLGATTNSGASPYDSGYCSVTGGVAHRARNDYDGDGKADLSLYNGTDQYIWKGLLSACQYAQITRTMGKRGDVPVPADYDGDGVTEPAFYNSASSAWLLLKPDQGILTYVFMLGGPGWEAAAADYDGDGLADPVVYRAATAEWQMYLSGGGYAAIHLAGGGPDWSVVSRDYDGDGRIDPAMYCEPNGLWSMLSSAGGYALVSVLFGGPGYTAIPADYDGDMKSDPAIYDESNGRWAFKLSSINYLTIILSQTLGGTGYTPVPADYDGDGRADPCVFNASTGEWRTLLSGNAYVLVGAVFGASGDNPTGP